MTWAIIAVSFFNMITLFWLGLTVLLNAERRAWGTWAAGGGLTLGGLFFAGHAAAVSLSPDNVGLEMALWWRAIWIPVVGAPYAWYLVITWYTGVLKTVWHRAWLTLVSLLGAAALMMLIVANPLPGLREFVYHSPSTVFSLSDIPIALLLYPVYDILCIGMALMALWRPEASERFMGDLARQRARPWLIAASIVLLGISLFVSAVAVWLLGAMLTGRVVLFDNPSLTLFKGIDLIISALLAVVSILLGKAVVSYEIFTGKTLPRRGLLRHWRNSLILAAGYSTVIGLSLVIPIPDILRLLLANGLMITFFALTNWRSYTERERSMGGLRPFVASQHLYEQLLRPSNPVDPDVVIPFRALCNDVLDAQVAYLIALGPLAPLVGPGMVYAGYAGESQRSLPPPSAINDLITQLYSPHTMCVQIDPAHYNGAVWAVPLWSNRGRIGVLLLGEKRDGGLYTQEEIEIACATGERLIDTQASAEIARRLMRMQRERLAESQVLDRQTRRVLHDDVLPQLHTTMLSLSSIQATNGQPIPEAITQLGNIHNQIANLLHAMPVTSAPEVIRLGLLSALRKAVDGELSGAFDTVTWQIDHGAEQAAQAIPHLAAEVIFFAAREVIRNAARYGRGEDVTRCLNLNIGISCRNVLEIRVEDDGVGMGTAPASTEGSGQGLALHSTMMAVIGGALTVERTPGTATRIVLTLPQPHAVSTIMPP